MVENSYERFAKWQGVTREQLGATSNLILGLATGLLGFTTLLLIENKLIAPCAFAFGVISMLLLALSIALALWCANNRLTDFRLTAKISNPKNSNNPELEIFREESRRLGDRTWKIFRSQVWRFALGAGANGVGILIQVT
jgi:hypothetical protein